MDGVEVEVVNDFAMLWGVVRNAEGTGVDALVITFPADERPRPQSVGITSVFQQRTRQDGRYVVPMLAPGEYYLLAVDPAEESGLEDEATLVEYQKQAMRITVSPNERRELDLALPK